MRTITAANIHYYMQLIVEILTTKISTISKFSLMTHDHNLSLFGQSIFHH